MFENIYLIFNPVSGRGDAITELSFIRDSLKQTPKVTVLETTPERSAGALAQEAIAQSADCLIASGGDGTVSAVAGVLFGSDIPLGIVPRGTANAIAAAFDIPSNDIDAACQIILSGVPRKIDVATCNGEPLLLLAGIGLEADVIEQTNRQLKNKMGTIAYIFSAFKEVQNLSPFQATLETPDRIITVEASGITVANAAPATSVLAQGPSDVVPYDGLLDVAIFAPQGTGGAIAASYNLLQTALSKRSTQRKDIGYFRCSSVKISADPAQGVVLDGEMIGDTPIDIRCFSKGLTLMTPKDGNFDPPEKLEGLPNLKIQHKEQ
ncbi:YegS/Rv2252/BmrU family lipid kinase [soil metagenome]